MVYHYERKGNFEEAYEMFATTVQTCLLESSNNCLHMEERFLCCFNNTDMWRKYFL